MRYIIRVLLIILLFSIMDLSEAKQMKLPLPDKKGKVPLETTLYLRRSIRDYQDAQITDREISQLLWAAQGITDAQGHRTAPSAGAIYPLEIYLVNERGVFHYIPETHSLAQIGKGDLRQELAEAALGQSAISSAPSIIVITGFLRNIESKYRDRAEQYTYQESGHVAQNIQLQAAALELGTVTIGAFNEVEVQKTLGLPKEHLPLYLIPVGKI